MVSTPPPKACALCGKPYTAPPAITRIDNRTEICHECGQRQALDAAGIPPEEQEKIIQKIREIESRYYEKET